MAPTFRIFVRTAEAEFQAFTWCRDGASGIARAWREGRRWPQRGRRLGGGNLMIDYVTIEIGSGGSSVMVEPELRKGLLAGCSAACWTATLEWAAYDDWRTHNERAASSASPRATFLLDDLLKGARHA